VSASAGFSRAWATLIFPAREDERLEGEPGVSRGHLERAAVGPGKLGSARGVITEHFRSALQELHKAHDNPGVALFDERKDGVKGFVDDPEIDHHLLIDGFEGFLSPFFEDGFYIEANGRSRASNLFGDLPITSASLDEGNDFPTPLMTFEFDFTLSPHPLFSFPWHFVPRIMGVHKSLTL